MKDTQKRITEYRAMLPNVREKVFAALFIFVISAVVMVSATFAWIALSTNPEAKGIATTVSANGNLEIALSDKDGLEPDKSEVGDSGKNILERNLTWGNLVNLSDDAYGLGNIELRPGALNKSNLLMNPLYGARYGEDGRITKLASDFGYSVYDKESRRFIVNNPTEYGVRAISSVKYENIGGENVFRNMLSQSEETNLRAGEKYLDIIRNDGYLNSLIGVIGTYASVRVGNDKNPDCSEYIDDLYEMTKAFDEAFQLSGEAFVILANAQQFKTIGEYYTPYTLDTLCSASVNELNKNGVKLSSLAQYKTDRASLKNCLKKFEDLKKQKDEQGSVKWNDISSSVNTLVNIGTCTLQAKNSNDPPTPINNITIGNATKFSGKNCYAVITQGLLKNFEKRTGILMSVLPNVKNLKVTVRNVPVIGTATITADVSTDAATPFGFNTDYNTVKNAGGDFAGTDAVAEDTYALAVDFWIRTNSSYTYLTLEGAALTEKTQTRAKDDSGNELWSASVEIDGQTITGDLIKKNDRWFLVDNGMDITDEIEKNGVTPIEKYEVIEKIIGYNGENRVWDNKNLSPDATTQGTGSCYVFYADTPQDQAQSLELLTSMKIAFVDSNGVLLSTAVMDTEHYYAESGRVMVPLILDASQSVYIGTDIEGNSVYGIKRLEKNKAERITALLYMEGSTLTNDKVLSASNIEGQLNIQFGSSDDLLPIGNEPLEGKEIKVTASMDRHSFDWETESENMVVNVEVNVEGHEPDRVEAFFLRKINSTQGTRQETMSFVKGGNVWKASQRFTSPGEYVLRNIRIDGVDYPLQEQQVVTIDGFAVQSLYCEADGQTLMTAERTTSTVLRLAFASSNQNKLPKVVKGIFLNENNIQSTVDFKLNTASHLYEGKATFSTSGKYIMQYLELDGETYELPAALWKSVTAYIGLSAEVNIDRTVPENAIITFEYNKEIKEAGGKTVAVSVRILDDTGNSLPAITDVDINLYYKMAGVTVPLKTDSGLVWDASMQSYRGNFLVTNAGIFSFRNLTVGENNITVASKSFVITAISPEPPAYYNAEETPSYQFSPDENAVFTLKISNSEAVTVRAVIENLSDPLKNGTVSGEIMDGSTVDLNNGTVSSWTFPIPGYGKQDSATQDGQWQVKSLLFGNCTVDDVFYDGSEGHVYKIDITSENVISKVVNTFTVNVSGQDKKTFASNYFMTENKESGRIITITDYEGSAIPGIQDVVLAYTFDYANIKEYNYEPTSFKFDEHPDLAESKYSCSPDSDGKIFSVPDMSFYYPGKYSGSLSFKVGSKTFTSGGDDFYCAVPAFEVAEWIRPTITITATNPAPSSLFDINLAGGTNKDFHKTHNYFDDYYANLYHSATSGLFSASYTTPKITLKLSNAGSNFTNTVFKVPIDKKNDVLQYNTFSFSGNNTSVTNQIGGIGDDYSASGASTRHSVNGGSGATIQTVEMTYGGKTFELKLSSDVRIYQGNALLGSFAYNVGAEYDDIINVSAEYNKIKTEAAEKGVSVVLNDKGIESNDGRQFSVTLPAATVTKIVSVPVGDAVITYRYTETTQPIKWSTGSGCDAKDHTGSQVTTVRETISTGNLADVERTYKIDKWKVETFSVATNASTGTTQVNPGTVRNIGWSNRHVATPIVSFVDGDQIGEPTSGSSVTNEETTVVWKEGSSTISEPAGWSNNGSATTKTWEADN